MRLRSICKLFFQKKFFVFFCILFFTLFLRYAFVAISAFVIFVKINKTQCARRVNVNAKKKQIVIHSFKIFDKFIEIICFRCAKFFYERFSDACVKSSHKRYVCCTNKNRFCEKINFCDLFS